MVRGDISLSFVGHTINKIDEIWQRISRRRVFRTRRNLAHPYRGPCCTTGPRLVNCGAESPPEVQNTEGVKDFCKAFLVHRLVERDEICHNEGHLCIVGHFGEF